MTLILNTFLHISTMHHVTMWNCHHQWMPNSERHIMHPVHNHSDTHTDNTREHKPHCCTVGLQTFVLSCHCHFAVSELDVPLTRPLPFDLIFTSLFICSTQPLRGLQPSAQEWFSQSIHVLCWCHRLSVLIFSCSDFLVGVGCLVLVSLVVLCLCRRVFSHGFDFLPSSWPNSTSNVLTSLLHTSSTHMGPPLGNLSPQTSNSHSYQILWWLWFFFFPLLHKRRCPHTSSLWLLFPTHLLPPLPYPPPPPSWIFFGDPASKRCVPFIPVCGLSHVALLDPICVVCSQTGAARAKCQAPSCCLHLPQWPAQCPSLCPTLNPTARPLTADSPRPHLRVSDPRRDRSEKKRTKRKKRNKTKSNNLRIPALSSEKTPAIRPPTPCHRSC